MFVKIDPQLRQSLQGFVQGRVANLRSWQEFGLFSRLRAPPSLRHAQLRIRYNILYFSSNYLFIFLVIFAITIIRRPLLLFALAFAFIGSFFIWENSTKPPITIMGRTFASHEQAFALVCICIPLLYMTSAGSFAFWLLTLCGILTLLHTWAMDTSHAIYDEEELNREVLQHWGERGIVIMSYIDKPTAALASLPIDHWLRQAGASSNPDPEDVIAQYSIDNIRAARAQQQAANLTDNNNSSHESSMEPLIIRNDSATVSSISATSSDITTLSPSPSTYNNNKPTVEELIDPRQQQVEESYYRERRQLLGNHDVEHQWKEPPTININDLLLSSNTETNIDGDEMRTNIDDIIEPKMFGATNTNGFLSSNIVRDEQHAVGDDNAETGEELC